MESDLVKKILDRYYGGDESKVPVIDYLGAPPVSVPSSLPGVKIASASDTITLSVGTTVPSTDEWLNILSGPEITWLRSLLTTPTIVQGSGYIDNPLQRLFKPRKGQVAVITRKDGLPISLSLKGSARSFGPHQADFEAVSVKYDPATKNISVVVSEERTGSSIPLPLSYVYRPDMGYAPIHEVVVGRNKRIKEFYWKLWYGDNQTLPSIDLRETFVGPEVTISEAEIERFCAVVGNDGESFKAGRASAVEAPMDFAIVTGWQVSLDLVLFRKHAHSNTVT